MTRALPTLVGAAFRATDRYVLYLYITYVHRDLGKLDFSIAAKANVLKRNDVALPVVVRKALDNLLYPGEISSVSFTIQSSAVAEIYL